MPSQIAHALCAEETLRATLPRTAHLIDTDPKIAAHLAFGAQGPDIFYHNQRRRPTSIQYGTLLHRRGYGTVTARLVADAAASGFSPSSALGAYIIGFITHAILDRHLHPYINYRAGRPIQGDPSTERYRTMHAFLERLIDVALLQELRGESTGEYSFLQKIEPMVTADPDGSEWVSPMERALVKTFDRAAEDTRLTQRLKNAWSDAIGYYRFTSGITPENMTEALHREEAGEISPHWLSIVHPPNVPNDIDVLNTQHADWTHPCSSRRRSSVSVVEMYHRSVKESIAIVTDLIPWWNALLGDTPKAGDPLIAIAERVGDYNLSDGRPRKRPCRPRHMAPLPLPELQQRIRDSIRHGSGGIV